MQVLGLFAGAAVAFALFDLREHRVSQPLIDFSPFARLAGLVTESTGSCPARRRRAGDHRRRRQQGPADGPAQGSAGLPALAETMVETAFKGWLTDAAASTLVVGVDLAVSGAPCAFLPRRNAHESRVATDTKAPLGSPQARPSPKLATPDHVRLRPAKEMPTTTANDTAPEVVTYGCRGGAACSGRRRARRPD